MLSDTQIAVREHFRSLSPEQMQKLLEDPKSAKEIEDFEADCCLDDFMSFIRVALSGEPGDPWECPALAMAAKLVEAPFMAIIAEELEDLSCGRATYMVINIPPGHLKSIIVSVLWQAWHWLREPGIQVGCISGVKEVVSRDSMRLRSLVQTDGYQALVLRASQRKPIKSPFDTQWFGYPVWGMSREQNEKVNFETSAGGKRLASPYGAGMTGARLTYLIFDDPLDVGETLKSASIVASTLAEMCQVYDEKYESRSFRGGVIVAQRLSEGDLPDHWIKTIKDVRVVCLPLLFESDHPNRHPKDARREGELLSVATMLTTKAWDRSAADMTQADLEAKAYELAAAFAKRLGDGAAGQLQQRPVPRGGVLFHKEWFTHRYAADPLIMAAECDEIAISADLAVKAKKNNDPNSMLVWGKRHRPRGYFLLGRINKRMEFTDQFMALRQLVASQERCHLVLVEEKQLGPAMVALLRSEIPIPVIGYDPKNVDKESRAKAVFPLWESGMVFLPTRDNCPWIDDYIREHLSFPRGRHDDDVDATTQMLTYWWLQSGEMAGSDVPRAKETLAALTGALHRMTQGAQGGFMR